MDEWFIQEKSYRIRYGIILAHRLLIKLKYVKYVHILKQISLFQDDFSHMAHNIPDIENFSLSLYRKKFWPTTNIFGSNFSRQFAIQIRFGTQDPSLHLLGPKLTAPITWNLVFQEIIMF